MCVCVCLLRSVWLCCRLVEMLQDYEQIQADIPPMILPMMKPYVTRVDDVMRPGLLALTWSSLNVDNCESLRRFKPEAYGS